MKRLGLGAELSALDAAHLKLNDFVSEVADWQFPVAFDKKREALRELLKVYDKAVANVTRHRKALGQVAASKKAGHREMLRQWRSNRDRVRDFLVENGVPEELAKAFANRVYADIVDPEPEGVKVTLVCPKVGLPSPYDMQAFSEPLCFHYDSNNLEENMGEFEVRLGRFYREHENAVISKMAELKRAMLLPNDPRNSAIGAVDVTQPFDFNPSFNPKLWGDSLPTLRLGVCAYWTEWCDVAIEAWPSRFLPALLIQFVGRASYIIVESGTVLDCQGQIEQWISNQSEKDLITFPIVTLTEGSALWLPVGFNAIFVGHCPLLQKQGAKIDMKERKTKSVVKHIGAVGIMPLFSRPYIQNVDVPMRRLVSATWLNASPKLLTTWTNAEEVKRWKADLDQGLE